MKTAHDLTAESLQWCKIPGGTPEDARTVYRCRKCGNSFTHRYNIQPDLYVAAAEAGFDLNTCEKI